MPFETDKPWPEEFERRERARLAHLCAEAIVLWHQKIGIERAHGVMNERRLSEYHKTLERCSKLDLHAWESQQQVAREQLSRHFEWAISEPLSPELWHALAMRWEVDFCCPDRLGDAARLILESHTRPEQPEKVPSRRAVHVASREELDRHAGEFYAGLATEEARGIGGKHVLLACSLERTPLSPCESESRQTTVILLGPDALGLRRVEEGEHPDGLLDQVRTERLAIDSIVGRPSGKPENRSGEH